MIVRILSEGQYRLPGAVIDDLNEIDNQIVEAVGNDDQPQFTARLEEMFTVVRQKGEPVPLEELVESDLILPEDDITLVEAKQIFVGEGILAG